MIIFQGNKTSEMAKQVSLIKISGTFQGMTTVKSRAYGEHIRKARTKFTISKGMKDSSAVLKEANVYAKVFKDAIDPYRRECRDGMMWQRLVSLFKKQLKKTGSADFRVLELEELNKIHPLARLISPQVALSPSEKKLSVQVTSTLIHDPTGRAEGYIQTVIILFVNDALDVQTFSEDAPFALDTRHNLQELNIAIPPAATTAIVVIKCNLSSESKPLNLQKGMGMRVVKVVKLV